MLQVLLQILMRKELWDVIASVGLMLADAFPALGYTLIIIGSLGSVATRLVS